MIHRMWGKYVQLNKIRTIGIALWFLMIGLVTGGCGRVVFWPDDCPSGPLSHCRPGGDARGGGDGKPCVPVLISGNSLSIDAQDFEETITGWIQENTDPPVLFSGATTESFNGCQALQVLSTADATMSSAVVLRTISSIPSTNGSFSVEPSVSYTWSVAARALGSDGCTGELLLNEFDANWQNTAHWSAETELDPDWKQLEVTATMAPTATWAQLQMTFYRRGSTILAGDIYQIDFAHFLQGQPAASTQCTCE